MIKLAALPPELKENLGLEMTDTGTFLSHNDHANKAILYAFDKNYFLSQALNFDNTSNIDW